MLNNLKHLVLGSFAVQYLAMTKYRIVLTQGRPIENVKSSVHQKSQQTDRDNKKEIICLRMN